MRSSHSPRSAWTTPPGAVSDGVSLAWPSRKGLARSSVFVYVPSVSFGISVRESGGDPGRSRRSALWLGRLRRGRLRSGGQDVRVRRRRVHAEAERRHGAPGSNACKPAQSMRSLEQCYDGAPPADVSGDAEIPNVEAEPVIVDPRILRSHDVSMASLASMSPPLVGEERLQPCVKNRVPGCPYFFRRFSSVTPTRS